MISYADSVPSATGTYSLSTTTTSPAFWVNAKTANKAKSKSLLISFGILKKFYNQIKLKFFTLSHDLFRINPTII